MTLFLQKEDIGAHHGFAFLKIIVVCPLFSAANNTSTQNTNSKGSNVGIGFSLGGTKNGVILDLGVTGKMLKWDLYTGASIRPEKFTVTYNVGSERPVRATYVNSPGGI
ncbi:hypothetical protein IFU20_27060 [Pseudomonas viridiflava]|uniref:hypothetical protein n=1 Tax=Pseudomonas viridiflava TaxID=33069 RepID=UPI0017807EEE|nr:hypothetical protein [Pseudomonas viridiflava]MBD8189837.1 hypothetical protein [Pseudomonas viridiflava]